MIDWTGIIFKPNIINCLNWSYEKLNNFVRNSGENLNLSEIIRNF